MYMVLNNDAPEYIIYLTCTHALRYAISTLGTINLVCLDQVSIGIFRTSLAFCGAFLQFKQPTSDSKILSLA